MDTGRPKSVVVYGAGQFGRFAVSQLHNAGLDVTGVVDRSATGFCEGVQVCLPERDAVAGQTVLVAVLNNGFDPIQAKQALLAQGATEVLFPPAWFKFLRSQVGTTCWYWLTTEPEPQDFDDRLERLVGQLADSESVSVVQGIRDFRRSGNPESLLPPRPESLQYIDGAPPGYWTGPVRLLDLGAYVGDTPTALLGQGTELASYVGFEPDSSNFDRLSDVIREFAFPAVGLCAASGYERGLASFSMTAASGSALNSESGTEVLMMRVDDLAAGEPFTHVKLDVEGAELETLRGAERTIVTQRPKVILSVYHKPWDLLDLTEHVLKFLGPADIHVRSYAHQTFETVVFLTPR